MGQLIFFVVSATLKGNHISKSHYFAKPLIDKYIGLLGHVVFIQYGKHCAYVLIGCTVQIARTTLRCRPLLIIACAYGN